MMADNEVRLIDANALKESLKHLKAKAYNQKYEQGLQDAIDGYFPQIIDNEPTIEAQPVQPMLKLIEHMQMMLTTIYDTGGCIQSEDMKCLIETSDRLKELVKGSRCYMREDGDSK